MSKIIIKKVVDLDFLGDEYKDAKIVFRSIPLPEYEALMKELPESNPEITELSQKAKANQITPEERQQLTELMQASGLDNGKSLTLIMKYLKQYFVSGKFPNVNTGDLEDLERDDLDGLDQEAATICFERLTGQSNDPKVSTTTSTSLSSTEVLPPSDS